MEPSGGESKLPPRYMSFLSSPKSECLELQGCPSSAPHFSPTCVSDACTSVIDLPEGHMTLNDSHAHAERYHCSPSCHSEMRKVEDEFAHSASGRTIPLLHSALPLRPWGTMEDYQERLPIRTCAPEKKQERKAERMLHHHHHGLPLFEALDRGRNPKP